MELENRDRKLEKKKWREKIPLEMRQSGVKEKEKVERENIIKK